MQTTIHPIKDASVQDAVEAELAWTAEVDPANVGVSVKDGVVTLSGEVRSHSERNAAAKAALRVRGVTALADDLRVRGSDGDASDTDIAIAVRNTLAWTAAVPRGAVKAEIDGGAVVLTGTVEWNFQREAAKRAVLRLSGVRSVESRIELLRKPSAPDVAEKVKNALVRNAILDAEHIHVAVDGSELTLTGTVRSWAEKEQAGLAAWSSPHVTVVHNSIVVTS